MKRRGPALAGLLLLALLVFSACAGLGEADGWASPVALDEDADIILVGSGEDQLFAVDVRSGAVIWAFPDNESAFRGLLGEVSADAFYTTPVAASAGGDELIIAEYDGGIVYGIQRDGSSARVIVDTGEQIVVDILVSGTTAFVATAAHRVLAVDLLQPEPDAPLWEFSNFEREVWGNAALAESERLGTIVIFPAMDGHIRALHAEGPEAGTLAWDRPTAGGVASSVVVADGLAFVGGFDRTFYALDVDSGEPRWTATGADWFWTRALIADGTIYAADLGGKVWAWDVRSGVERWVTPYDAGDGVRAQPILAPFAGGDVVVVVTRKGLIHAINARTGEQVWHEPLLDIPGDILADPIRRGDRVLVSNDRTELFSIRVGDPALRQVFPPPEGGR